MNKSPSKDPTRKCSDNSACYSSASSSPNDFSSDDDTINDNLFLVKRRYNKNDRLKNINDLYNQDTVYQENYPALPYLENYDPDRPRNRVNSNLQHETQTLNGYDEACKKASGDDTIFTTLLPNSNAINVQRNSLIDSSQNTSFNMPRYPRNQQKANTSRILHERRAIDLNHDGPTSFEYENPSVSHMDSPLLDSFQQNQTCTMNLCSQLLHSRTLAEAIEFVEQNRTIICDLTRVVTEAPPSIDFDMNNYKIDLSVKESFNPHFWLDREPVVTTADGNCQYHAISLCLTGTEDYTPEVRLATAVAVIDNRTWFESILRIIDRGSVLELVRTIARNFAWGDETTLKAISIATNRRIYLYTCNPGKSDFEVVKNMSKDELLEAFNERQYRGGTGIHTYANPLKPVSSRSYLMMFHKSEHFIAILPKSQHVTNYEPYNPIVPDFL